MITLREFLGLPTDDVARLVRTAGSQVCVFPVNGTRRWFALEHGDTETTSEYIRISALMYITLFRLLYDHGIDTILSPLFGSESLRRGQEYADATLSGVPILEMPEFLNFYREYDARVRFYGDYRHLLKDTPHAGLVDFCERLEARTLNHSRRRLFYGFFADDATRQAGEITIKHHGSHGCTPDRKSLAAAYYGEPVDPVTLFVGFDRFSVFDYPFLGTGDESLYFTVAPTPYMDAGALRRILYDHLYTKRTADPDWPTYLHGDDLRSYYHANRNNILGVGRLMSGVWVPVTAAEED